MNNNRQYIYERFPESLFSAQDTKAYCLRLERGLEEAKQSTVAIVGICRSIGQILDHSVARMYKTASLFSDYRFIIYENDSSDSTSQRLKAYADQDDRFILLQETLGEKQFKSVREYDRASYLSSLRNKYLDHLKQLDRINYVIVIDLDLEGGWSYDGILNSLSYTDLGWSAMTANCIYYVKNTVSVKREGEVVDNQCEIDRLFYDTWAYREDGDERIGPESDIGQLKFERGEHPMKVFSNFGGLGVYNYSDIIQCEYGAIRHDDETVTCDHPFLHKQMRDLGCNIYLNPSMISLYSPHEFSAQL
jgi:glycosyltransferase involved in cell wall biosynthesis